YNPNQDDEQRRSFENLILLCANHHIVTDDMKEYSVAKLKEMKRVHEKKCIHSSCDVSDKIVDELLSKYTKSNITNISNSSNIKVVNNVGFDYTQTRELFLDLFESNFPKLRKVAVEEAGIRVQAFLQKFFGEASRYLKSEDIDYFKEPDLQFILYSAIESAARRDSATLRSVLASLLIKTIKTGNAEAKQQIYKEAIAAAGRLSIKQLKFITLNFLLYHQIFKIKAESWLDLESYFENKVKAFIDVSNAYATYADVCHIAQCCQCSFSFSNIASSHSLEKAGHNYANMFLYKDKELALILTQKDDFMVGDEENVNDFMNRSNS
ncbi:MAG: LPO_1073/Vpar_1526 family protein, partial [Spirulinaceae cyanobacterium]